VFDSLKSIHAQYVYGHGLLSDTVRRHGKMLQRAIELPRFLGTEYECPVCRVGLRAFRPTWNSYSRDAAKFASIDPASKMEASNLAAFTCPRCNALDRDRLIAIYLEQVFATFDPNRAYRLIEFAPGDALQKKLKRYPFILYGSADLSGKTPDETLDLTKMVRYGDASIDIILCSNVLEHIPQDRKAMSEIRRALRGDGFAIILVPLVLGDEDTHEKVRIDSEALRCRDFGMGDHVRQYGKRDFIARLKGAGLRVEQLGIEHFGAEVFRRAGIAATSVLYVARPR
jgi:SAM-dependent methyltransferase